MEFKDKEKLYRRVQHTLQQAGLIIVEGLHDQRALEELGVVTPILKANAKPERVAQQALTLLGETSQQPVLLLFDFDLEGERKLRDYREALATTGLHCDAQTRRQIRLLTGITHVEDLPRPWHELEQQLARGSAGRVTIR